MKVKKKVLILMVILMASTVFTFTACESVDERTAPRQHVTLNGRDVYFEVPSTPPPAEGYSVIFGLHGATMGYESWYQEGTVMYVLPNGWNILDTEHMYGTVKWARANNYVIVMPDSLDDPRCALPGANGRKGWDLQGLTMDTNHDYPFLSDILDWLAANKPAKINADRITLLGICNGAAFATGVQLCPELRHRFAAYITGSGGYPGHLPESVSWGLQGCNTGFDCESDIDIPADSAPTIMGVGPADSIMPTEFCMNYFRNLQRVGVPSIRMGEEWGWFPPGHNYPDGYEDIFMDWILAELAK